MKSKLSIDIQPRELSTNPVLKTKRRVPPTRGTVPARRHREQSSSELHAQHFLLFIFILLLASILLSPIAPTHAQETGVPIDTLSHIESIQELIRIANEHVTVIHANSLSDLELMLWAQSESLHTSIRAEVDRVGFYDIAVNVLLSYHQRVAEINDPNRISGVVLVRESDMNQGLSSEVKDHLLATGVSQDIVDLPLSTLEGLTFTFMESQLQAAAINSGIIGPTEVEITVAVLPDTEIGDVLPVFNNPEVRQDGGKTQIPILTLGAKSIFWPPDVDWLIVDSEPFLHGTNPIHFHLGDTDATLPVNTGWVHEEAHLNGNAGDLYHGNFGEEDTPMNWQSFGIRRFILGFGDIMSATGYSVTLLSSLQTAISISQGKYDAMRDGPIEYPLVNTADITIFPTTSTFTLDLRSDPRMHYFVPIPVDDGVFDFPIPNIFHILSGAQDPLNTGIGNDEYALTIILSSHYADILSALGNERFVTTTLMTEESYLKIENDGTVIAKAPIPYSSSLFSRDPGELYLVWQVLPRSLLFESPNLEFRERVEGARVGTFTAQRQNGTDRVYIYPSPTTTIYTNDFVYAQTTLTVLPIGDERSPGSTTSTVNGYMYLVDSNGTAWMKVQTNDGTIGWVQSTDGTLVLD